MYKNIDTESIILENIYDSEDQKTILRQRDLAQIAGISLGMTNSILRRLAQKGWISIKKLNHRNIQYAMTIEGMNEIISRSYNYFKRTIKNTVHYKEILDDIIRQAKQKKITAVILVGLSDLDFILEHICYHYGMSFLKAAGPETMLGKEANNTLRIYSETIINASGIKDENSVFLSKILLKQGMTQRL